MRFVIAFAAALALSAPTVSAQEETGLPYADFLIAAYDENGDGVLSPRELGATGQANFEEIDIDGDGVASRDELAAWYLLYKNN